MTRSSTHTFTFTIHHRSTISKARVGTIETAHGPIETPAFVAVGTNGVIKALTPDQLSEAGVQLMFCNTYHLMVQPGTNVIKEAGGLHSFMGRSLPLITDSGGFQVFSLAYGGVADELKSRGQKKQSASVLKITEEGVLFRSYRDGSPLLLTPESSVAAQKDLGADIIIPFDELPPYHIEKSALQNSLQRTHRWQERSLSAHLKRPERQAMYAVIHGGVDRQMRKESCSFLTKLPFDGHAIGGSMGKEKEEMHALLSYTLRQLPEEKPIHLLGIGDLPSIARSVPLGIDTFDSSYPTKAARHGILLCEQGGLNITQGKYGRDLSAVVEGCACPTCRTTSKAYLHHLFKAKELTALSLSSLHNLFFMSRWMAHLRELILSDKL